MCLTYCSPENLCSINALNAARNFLNASLVAVENFTRNTRDFTIRCKKKKEIDKVKGGGKILRNIELKGGSC